MNKKIHEKSKNHWSMTIWINLVETHPKYTANKFGVDLVISFQEKVESVNRYEIAHWLTC